MLILNNNLFILPSNFYLAKSHSFSSSHICLLLEKYYKYPEEPWGGTQNQECSCIVLKKNIIFFNFLVDLYLVPLILEANKCELKILNAWKKRWPNLEIILCIAIIYSLKFKFYWVLSVCMCMCLPYYLRATVNNIIMVFSELSK